MVDDFRLFLASKDPAWLERFDAAIEKDSAGLSPEEKQRAANSMQALGNLYLAVGYYAERLGICDAADRGLREKVKGYLVAEHGIQHPEKMTPREWMGVLEANFANRHGPWSQADSPTRWAKKWKISPRTFKKRVAEGKIRAKVLSDRSYQILLEDLPK